MPDYRLTHAVTDREGCPLLAAGTRLTQIVHGNARQPVRLTPMQTGCLLDYRQVKSDLMGFFAASPYDVIFQRIRQRQGKLFATLPGKSSCL
jgi:hypothetical protein